MPNQKETILFVHGAWHGKWCWDKYFRAAFSNQGYNVITFNLPGHDRPGQVSGINRISFGTYVQALKEQVNKLEELPIIVGHSMGGLIVQKYLETATCKKAILLASVPPYGVINTTLRLARKPFFFPSLLGLNLFKIVNSQEKSKDAFFSEGIDESELKEYTDQLCSESFSAFLTMLLPQVKVNQNADIPILVLGARNDTIFTVRDNEITAQKFNADLIILEDIAHDMMLDTNHQATSEAIINWLEKS